MPNEFRPCPFASLHTGKAKQVGIFLLHWFFVLIYSINTNFRHHLFRGIIEKMFSVMSKMSCLIVIFLGMIALANGAPLALHQLIVVDAAGNAVIRLQGYDTATASNKVSSCMRINYLVW